MLPANCIYSLSVQNDTSLSTPHCGILWRYPHLTEALCHYTTIMEYMCSLETGILKRNKGRLYSQRRCVYYYDRYERVLPYSLQLSSCNESVISLGHSEHRFSQIQLRRFLVSGCLSSHPGEVAYVEGQKSVRLPSVDVGTMGRAPLRGPVGFDACLHSSSHLLCIETCRARF